ncbi:piggyBac transposable element-derived protein 4-like [Schistocerca nitens]|uniref:piggyBac transposable element-derived protein 4-like n=1 Tax=Schistocerca nitens TaxID=7011 RepID=UPI0021198145|nr:piggyBac transposable element-derived protein 4-like [Schistocerca nitens]
MQLFTIMVTETNRYARQVIQSTHLSPNSRLKQWQPTTVAEMRAFIAAVLNMGLIKKPTIFSYWSTDANLLTPWFSQMFSRNRFQLLLRFFHFVDNSKLHPPGHPLCDPTAKFQVLVDIANNVFLRYYTPHQQLSVDESLVGTKAYSHLIQYLPNKHHHRWEVKFWMLCDSVVNYCLGFYVYRGAKSDDDKNEIKENGLGYVVVMKLLTLGSYMQKGYHVFCDNFFTSIPLAEKLYSVGTYLTGTIRRKRKFLPRGLLSNYAVGQLKFFKKSFILLCGFRQKKSQRNPVLLVSTSSSATSSEKTIRNRQSVKKPDVIFEYNKYMGGI